MCTEELPQIGEHKEETRKSGSRWCSQARELKLFAFRVNMLFVWFSDDTLV